MDKWFCGTAVASMDRGGFLKIQIWKKKLIFGDLMKKLLSKANSSSKTPGQEHPSSK